MRKALLGVWVLEKGLNVLHSPMNPFIISFLLVEKGYFRGP